MEVVKFADIVTRVNTKEDRFNTDKIYYVGGDHIDSNEMMVHQRGIIKGSTIGPMFYCGFKAGDILFVTRNPHLRKCAVVDFDGICSEKTFVLATKDPSRLLQEYLALVMQSDDFWNYCEENKSGGVNFFLNWSTLADYEFSLPSLEEQKILADKLWAAYRVKESYRQLLATTDDMLKAKFIDMFGDVDKPVNGMPFEQAFDIKDNLRKPLNETARSTMHDGAELYPYYGANGLVDRINQYMIDMEALCLAEDCGDFASGGDTAYIISGKSWVNNHAHILVPKDNCRIEFARMLFKVMDLEKFVDNDNRQKLTQANMKKITLHIPPLDDQDKFVAIATQAEATKASLRQSIDAIDRVIRSLINQQNVH